MQVRIIFTVCLFAISSLATASITTTKADTFRYGLATKRLVQVGVRYQSAVRMELEVPTIELLIQPVEYISIGFRLGSVRTEKLPELFEDSRGRMSGFVLRGNLPLDSQGDLFIEYAKMTGDLPFAANVYGIVESSQSENFRPSASLSGKVSFLQNAFQIGYRQHFLRYFFVEGSMGILFEDFILKAEGLRNSKTAIGYIFDFTNELPPNEWFKNIGYRVGISAGLRF